jgi:hypothetical protein
MTLPEILASYYAVVNLILQMFFAIVRWNVSWLTQIPAEKAGSYKCHQSTNAGFKGSRKNNFTFSASIHPT